MARKKRTTKRKGLFDIFRDALETVEEVQKKQVEKKAGLPGTFGKKKKTKSILDDITQSKDRDERYTKMDRKREQRQRSFDQYLEKIGGERNVDVDSHNQEVIEAFIATHEERTEQMREKFEQEVLRARQRFDDKLHSVTERHRDRLRRMVDQANDGRRIRIAESQFGGPIRGGQIKLPNRGRIMIRRR